MQRRFLVVVGSSPWQHHPHVHPSSLSPCLSILVAFILPKYRRFHSVREYTISYIKAAHAMRVTLSQGSATCGSRATCGSLDVKLWLFIRKYYLFYQKCILLASNTFTRELPKYVIFAKIKKKTKMVQTAPWYARSDKCVRASRPSPHTGGHETIYLGPSINYVTRISWIFDPSSPCHSWSHFWDPGLVWRHIFWNFTPRNY